MKPSMQEYKKEKMAIAFSPSNGISTKQSVEISHFLRYMKTSDAKTALEMVITKKKAIPFRRYKRDLAHRTSIGPGRYPIKAAQEFLKLVKNAEANAQQKNLDTSNLEIVHCVANKAVRSWHYGRQRRRKTKSTHLEIVVQEMAKEQKKEDKKKSKSSKEGEK